MASDWDTAPNGNLLAYPLVGWGTRSARMIGLLRLRYATSDEEYEAGGIALQVHMTPTQLRQLSQDLSNMADHIDAAYLGSPQ